MPYRWVLSPVSNLVIPDLEGGEPDIFRAPKVFEHVEPGRNKRYQHSSIINVGAWCLSVVMANDFTPLDADPSCIGLLETNFADQLHLDQSPRDLGWVVPHLNRIKTRLEARGVDTSAFTRDTPLFDILQALVRALHPRFGSIRRTWLRPSTKLFLPFIEDAIIVQDEFTEGADTDLTAHTPSPTGTSWIQVAQVGTTKARIIATADDIRWNGATNEGECVKSQPDPSVNEYDVQWTINAYDTGTGTQPRRLHGRLADISNYYAAKLLPTGHASNTDELYKVVATTKTQLATVDSAWVATDTHMLRMRDAAKEVFRNGASILSNADNVLTAAGSAAVSGGKISATDTGNGNTNNFRFDDYIVDEVAGEPEPEPDVGRLPLKALQNRHELEQIPIRQWR